MLYFNAPPKQLIQYGPWLHMKNFMTPEECERVIALMNELNDAKVDTSGKKNSFIREAKVGNVKNLPENMWIYDKISKAVITNNQAIYQFDILGFYEPIQLIRYEPGHHYDWHQDFAAGIHSTRKLSVSVQLSPSDDYEGGDLEFSRFGRAPREQGTLILFPSFIEHKVHPVESGIRNALVAWVNGNPFR